MVPSRCFASLTLAQQINEHLSVGLYRIFTCNRVGLQRCRVLNAKKRQPLVTLVISSWGIKGSKSVGVGWFLLKCCIMMMMMMIGFKNFLGHRLDLFSRFRTDLEITNSWTQHQRRTHKTHKKKKHPKKSTDKKVYPKNCAFQIELSC